MNTIKIDKYILGENDKEAQKLKEYFDEKKLVVINVLASPGAGKTSLILRLLELLPSDSFKAVIEGDVASSVDTDKIIKAGYNAVQINTQGGCHLTAEMVMKAASRLSLVASEKQDINLASDQRPATSDFSGFLFIENIGNLICTSEFYLGERIRMVVASIPEGDDKPLKYPYIFSMADIVVVNKCDVRDAFDFDDAKFEKAVRVVNNDVPIVYVSSKTGEGLSVVISSIKANYSV